MEMSGGLKRAQHALERPLDRRVGPQPGGGECFAHLPMVARQACAASAVPKRRGLRSPAKHPDQQRARFKRRPCFACSEPDGPPAGRRRTDSPACLERTTDGATLALSLFRAPKDAARDQRIRFPWRQADGERAANGRTARRRMLRDAAGRNAQRRRELTSAGESYRGRPCTQRSAYNLLHHLGPNV